MPPGHSSVLKLYSSFRTVLAVSAAEGKTGFGSLKGEVTCTDVGGLLKCFLVIPSVKTIFTCKFSDLGKWYSWLQRVKKG